MNFDLFFDELKTAFDKSDVKPGQAAVLREKTRRFTGDQLSKLYDSILENCKYFPKVADIYERARELGYMAEHRQDRPHIWETTDCGFCEGSGLMAVFWSQEFEMGERGKRQFLKCVHVTPYHRSGARHRSTSDEIRAVYRCQCSAGVAETLQSGLPRWSERQPLEIERPWG